MTTLAELCIVACAQAFADDGEVLASGIGPLPLLAVGLAKITCNPLLLLTDGANMLLEEPLVDGAEPRYEGKMPFADIFDLIYAGGKRHAMVTPVQMDSSGQTNISLIGSYEKPKASLLGVRGFPGNTIYHANSFFIPAHSKRSFVEGSVDMVSGVGYREDLWHEGKKPPFLDLRRVITNLAVLDFGGKGHRMRMVSVHPGVSAQKVQDNTGFEVEVPEKVPTTPLPTQEQIRVIEQLDSKGIRHKIFPENPTVRAS